MGHGTDEPRYDNPNRPAGAGSADMPGAKVKDPDMSMFDELVKTTHSNRGSLSDQLNNPFIHAQRKS